MQSDADIDAGVDTAAGAVSLAASGRYGIATGHLELGSAGLLNSRLTTASLANLLYSDALLGRRPTYIYTPIAESLNL